MYRSVIRNGRTYRVIHNAIEYYSDVRTAQADPQIFWICGLTADPIPSIFLARILFV